MVQPNTILDAWKWRYTPSLHPVDSGLINETFRVTVTKKQRPVAVLQRLNTDVFIPEVHEDIAAITTRLTERNVKTPSLIPTRKGDLWHTDDDGGVWRCLSWIGKRTIHRIDDLKEAFNAGKHVAKFHGAVHGLNWQFRSIRPGAHDTVAHMARLQSVLASRSHHRLYKHLYPVAHRILDHWDTWEGPDNLPSRIIHGDLKLSNVRFDQHRAIALIDLDTLAYGTLDMELGDAMRSWCNVAGESSADAHLDLNIFEAAIKGYASGIKKGPPITRDEWNSIVPGLERICLELAARFAIDTLEERYFGWSDQYPSRGRHNLVRAQSQYSLALAIHQMRSEATQIVREVRS